MKFKAIILEGADCCGKTSFAKELYSREKNAVLVHFPRLNALDSIEPAIKNLTRTLYNPLFMKKFEGLGKFNFYDTGTEFDNMNDDLISAMTKNIHANAEDKNNFLNTLEAIKNKYIRYAESTDKEKKELHLEDCKSKLHHFLSYSNIVSAKLYNKDYKDKEESYEEREKRIKKFIKSDDTLVIIFDRFFMSGDVYNYTVPINVYMGYINRIKKEFTEFTLEYDRTMNDDYKRCAKEYIENNKKQIMDDIERYENSILRRVEMLRVAEIDATKNIIKKCNYIFTNPVEDHPYIDENSFNFDGKLILNPIDITHLIFKTNKKLVDVSKSDSKRKFDDYDQNIDIQNISRICFDIYQQNISDFTRKLIDNGFKYITGEYFIRSIVVDSNEYLSVKTTNPKAIIRIGPDGSKLVSNDDGLTWKINNDIKLKVVANKKELNYVMQKIDILNDNNADSAITNISNAYHFRSHTLKSISKVSRTSDIGIEE